MTEESDSTIFIQYTCVITSEGNLHDFFVWVDVRHVPLAEAVGAEQLGCAVAEHKCRELSAAGHLRHAAVFGALALVALSLVIVAEMSNPPSA